MEKLSSDTNSRKTSGKSSDRLIDRFLYHFKMVRNHRPRSHSAESPAPSCNNLSKSSSWITLGKRETEESSVLDTSPHNQIQSRSRIECPPDLAAAMSNEEEYYNQDYQYEWQYRKITHEDLKPFCEQLGKFLEYVRNIQDLTFLMYDYPRGLQNRMERDANEIESIYAAVRSAVSNIETVKQQRQAVRKELKTAKKTLKKVRDEETREIETMLHLHDKVMQARWENVKNCHKPEVLENLLDDVKNKQRALDGLCTLLSRKISSIPVFLPITNNVENTDKLANSTTPTDRQTLLAVRRYHQGAGSTSPRSYRRRRPTENNSGGSGSPRGVVIGPLPSPIPLPLSLGGYPFNIPSFGVGAATASSSSTTVTSDDSNSSTNPSANLTPASVTGPSITNNNLNLLNLNNNNSTVGNEFATEMRSVLQALFGELRRTPSQDRSSTLSDTIVIDDTPTSLETSTVAGSDNTLAKEIQLFTMQKPPPAN